MTLSGLRDRRRVTVATSYSACIITAGLLEFSQGDEYVRWWPLWGGLGVFTYIHQLCLVAIGIHLLM